MLARLWRRIETLTVGGELSFSGSVDAKVATPIHLPMMVSAEEALARSRKASEVGGDEMKDAIVAVLLAAVSLEAATHWVADRLDSAFRAEIEMLTLPEKWAAVVKRRDGVGPDLGRGLGQAVDRLADDRNWIAHYPGKGRAAFTTPRRADGGKSPARAHFTAELAAQSIATATGAIRAIGEVWARAGVATGTGQAYDASVSIGATPEK
jgi:hypothetical protein